MSDQDAAIQFSRGAMDRLRDESGIMFVSVPPGIRMFASPRDGFRGYYLLESSRFILKNRAHIVAGRIEVDDKPSSSLPRANDEVIGDVVGIHDVNWIRETWNGVYRSLVDAYYAVDGENTNHIVSGAMVGLFDEEGALEAILEISLQGAPKA